MTLPRIIVPLLCVTLVGCPEISPECLPSAETCNGLDDDCNGIVDDLEPIACGTGACARELVACIDAVEQACDPMEGSSPETCDFVDNDCDGATDEGLADLSCGVGACLHTEPACVQGVPQVCDPMAGASAEVCDDVDNDCNGATDDGLPFSFTGGPFRGDAGKFIGEACGTGVCLGGVVVCDGPDSLKCSTSDAVVTETCDAVDNDCDGQTDEDFDELETSCGVGICSGGTYECDADDSSSTRCSTSPLAVEEACNSLDDDCDGETDEDFGLGEPCGTGACTGGVVACELSSGQPVCSTDALASPDDQCDGVDQDCNGVTDDAFAPGGSVSYVDWDETERYLGDACGTGQCAGTVVCDTDKTLRCDGAEPSADDPCDGLDNNCDGVIDELYLPGGPRFFSLEDGSKLGLGEVCFEDATNQGVVVCGPGGTSLACSYSDACHGVAPSLVIGPAEDILCGGGFACLDPSTTSLWETSCGCGSVLSIGEVVCSIGTCGFNLEGEEVCSQVSMVDTCIAPLPQVDDTCNGIDEDCDGETDEHFKDTGADPFCSTTCIDGQPLTVCS